MRAAVFTGERELQLTEVEVPEIGDDDLLIKVTACGICHTDEGFIEGTPTFKKPPIILGHEASGRVSQVGKNVTNFKVDDPVLIPPVMTCGYCRFCINGRETLCSNQNFMGSHTDGAFAEYVKVPAKDIVKVPETLPLADVAIVSDAVATPYHAVFERAHVQPGDVVAVIGCGGVGINVVQMAVVAGAKVIALDLIDSKLELAKQFGAHLTINPRKEDVKKRIRAYTSHVDISFEVIGNPKTQELAFSLLSPGGKMVAVGYSPKPWDGFNSGKVMFREMEIIGSLGCPPKSFPKIIHLLETKKIKLDNLITHRYKLEQINEAFEQLRKGEGVRILIEL